MCENNKKIALNEYPQKFLIELPTFHHNMIFGKFRKSVSSEKN